MVLSERSNECLLKRVRVFKWKKRGRGNYHYCSSWKCFEG